MSLPFTYTKTIEITDSENFQSEEVMWELIYHLKKEDSVKEISVESNKISFSYQSLFTIRYEIEFNISKNNGLVLAYEIKLSKLIQVCIVLAIFIAFFSRFKISGYLWFSSIFIIVFYTFNLLFTDKLIQKLIESSKLFHEFGPENEGIISEEQKNWIRDASKCPACGEDINEFDLKCPDCGLRLRNIAKQSPFNVSKYLNKRFKYHFSEKKKNKNDT
jgi:hypothetical protein